MGNILDRLQRISDFFSNLLTSSLLQPDSITNFFARVIIFVIVIFLSLVILGFTGILENPIGL